MPIDLDKYTTIFAFVGPTAPANYTVYYVIASSSYLWYIKQNTITNAPGTVSA